MCRWADEIQKSSFRRCLHPFDRDDDLLAVYTQQRADLVCQLCHGGDRAEQFVRSSYMSRIYTF